METLGDTRRGNPVICPFLTVAASFVSIAMKQKSLIVGDSIQAAPALCVEHQCGLWTGTMCGLKAVGMEDMGGVEK